MSIRAFIPNPNAGDELMAEETFRQGLGGSDPLSKAIDLAKNFAPVDQGNYRDGLRVIVDDDGVWLVGTYFTSLWIEYGSATVTASSPLRRGALGAGLRLEETDPTGV